MIASDWIIYVVSPFVKNYFVVITTEKRRGDLSKMPIMPGFFGAPAGIRRSDGGGEKRGTYIPLLARAAPGKPHAPRGTRFVDFDGKVEKPGTHIRGRISVSEGASGRKEKIR